MQPSSRTDWIIAVAAMIAVIVAIFQGALLYQQYVASGEAAKQTDAIKNAQKDIASASKSSAATMEESLTQARDATKETLAQGRRSLEKAIEMSRNAQRAWVGPVDMSKPEISPGLRPRISIPITNSGRTPAKAVTVEFGAKISPCEKTCDKPFKAEYIPNEDIGPQGVAVLQPNAHHSLNCIRKDPFTEEEVDGIESKTMFFVVYGRINYKDVFGRDHEAKFAYRWVPDVPCWRSCGNYNTTD